MNTSAIGIRMLSVTSTILNECSHGFLRFFHGGVCILPNRPIRPRPHPSPSFLPTRLFLVIQSLDAIGLWCYRVLLNIP